VFHEETSSFSFTNCLYYDSCVSVEGDDSFEIFTSIDKLLASHASMKLSLLPRFVSSFLSSLIRCQL